MALKTVTIIGGGLAGLTLGIGLRHRGVPVVLWEAGTYPRHRVCGEFISGRGQNTLARLGLLKPLVEAGAVSARTATFFSSSSSSPVRPLEQAALCLSRFTLDALLAGHFQRSGGELREKQRWLGEGTEEGIVLANGRRPQTVENGWRWFGIKIHAIGARLASDLEMHLSPAGYVGLCRLTGGKVNVCGLFRRRAAAHHSTQSWRELLRGSPETALHQRLSQAVFEESSFCSVAGLPLRPQRAAARSECCIGDAITMIPPVTGNGMSMAFESGEIAIEPLSAYSRGEVSWKRARQAIAGSCDAAFRQRLTWARWLQWMMFTPALQNGVSSILLRSELAWRMMFEKTR